MATSNDCREFENSPPPSGADARPRILRDASEALAFLVIAVCLVAVTGCGNKPAGPDAHDDHPEHAEPAGHDEHAGHDHDGAGHADADEPGHDDDGGHDDHAGHVDEVAVGSVVLTAQQRERIGLKLARAAPGRISLTRTFPGEVRLDPDRMAHVVPLAQGIVRSTHKTIGDPVQAGEIIAWVESKELAEAKLDFYAKESAIGSTELDLPRTKAVFDNTSRLLELLDTSPDPEALRALDGLSMGDYRALLLPAFSDYQAAQRAYERERGLRNENIGSEQELLEARNALERARAEYFGAKENAHYTVLGEYAAAVRTRQVAEFEAVAAHKQLHLLGVDEKEVAALRALVPQTGGLEACTCEDPGCPRRQVPRSVFETLGSDDRLGWYAIRAPISGILTEKHLTMGEMVRSEESVCTIADTSAVWIHFNVFQKDLGLVEPGQDAVVELNGQGVGHHGKLVYLAPIVDEETRTVAARVILDNGGGALRPGLFTTVRVAVQDKECAVVISKPVVQVLEEKPVVFVPDGNNIEAIPVVLGLSDSEQVEVVSGLHAGQEYVLEGGFAIKAKIVTSGLGAHAGHGH